MPKRPAVTRDDLNRSVILLQLGKCVKRRLNGFVRRQARGECQRNNDHQKKIGQKPLDAGIRVLESDLTDNTLDSCVTDQGGNEVEFSFSVCSGICDGGKTWAKKNDALAERQFFSPCGTLRKFGARKRTRTSTPVKAPAPEAGASTNFAIRASVEEMNFA